MPQIHCYINLPKQSYSESHGYFHYSIKKPIIVNFYFSDDLIFEIDELTFLIRIVSFIIGSLLYFTLATNRVIVLNGSEKLMLSIKKQFVNQNTTILL